MIFLNVILILLQSTIFAQNLDYPKTPLEYEHQVQKILDNYSEFYKSGFQFALIHEKHNFTFASGPNDLKDKKSKLTTEDRVGFGSLTKTYTAMGIMKLVQDGKIGLNQTISSLVDDFLQRTENTTLLEMWQGNTKINEVTVFQLLNMKSGIGDYEDDLMYAFTLLNPDETFTPMYYLRNISSTGTFECNPGHCYYYSSNNYLLLGLALC